MGIILSNTSDIERPASPVSPETKEKSQPDFESTLDVLTATNVSDMRMYEAFKTFGKVSHVDRLTNRRFLIILTTTQPIEQLITQQNITVNEIGIMIMQIRTRDPSEETETEESDDISDDFVVIDKAIDIDGESADDSPLHMLNMSPDNSVFLAKYKGNLIFGEGMPNCAPLWLIEEILCKFGSKITMADTRTAKANEHIIFRLVTKYCLSVRKIICNILDSPLPPIKCQRLYELHIDHGWLRDSLATDVFFWSNRQLASLTIDRVSGVYDIDRILRPLRKLEFLSLYSQGDHLGKNLAYFGRMRHLKELHLECISLADIVRILKPMAQSGLPLEKLYLSNVIGPAWKIGCFTQMKTLKTLQLVNVENTEEILAEMIRGCVRVERLKVNQGFGDNNTFIASIVRMKAIEFLHIDTITDASLARIVQKNKRLTSVETNSPELTFNGIRYALEQGANLKTMRAQFVLEPGTPLIDNKAINAINALRNMRSIDLLVSLTYETLSSEEEEFLKTHQDWLQYAQA